MQHDVPTDWNHNQRMAICHEITFFHCNLWILFAFFLSLEWTKIKMLSTVEKWNWPWFSFFFFACWKNVNICRLAFIFFFNTLVHSTSSKCSWKWLFFSRMHYSDGNVFAMRRNQHENVNFSFYKIYSFHLKTFLNWNEASKQITHCN